MSQRKPAPGHRPAIWVGWLLIAGGLVVNKWTIEATLSPDERIESVTVLAVLAGFQLSCLALGAYAVLRGPSVVLPLSSSLLLLTLGLLAGIVLAEATLRLFPAYRPQPRAYVGQYPNRPSPNFVADPRIGWRMRPLHEFTGWTDGRTVHYRGNAQGFRSEFDFDTAESRKVIVLTGDSFSWGTGVETPEGLATRIDHRLPAAVVHNLAMPGFGLDQIWMSVRHPGLGFSPQLVIVTFIDHDWDRSLTAFRRGEKFNKPTFVLRDGRLVPRTSEHRPGGVVRSLDKHSYLWTALRVATRHLAYRFPVGEWWELNRSICDAILADCRREQVPLLFVRLPLKKRREFTTLRSHMRRVGANYIDLNDPRAARPAGIHFATDGHMNASGHAWVADVILEWIAANLPELAYGAGRSS